MAVNDNDGLMSFIVPPPEIRPARCGQ